MNEPPNVSTGVLVRVHASYRTRTFYEGEVEQVCRLGEAVLGAGHHPTAAVLRARLAVCRNALTIIEFGEAHELRLAGYLILYPLTNKACELILAGDITSGAGLMPELLHSRHADAAGLYIGMVLGTDQGIDRAAAASLAIDTISDRAATVQHVFARAGSPFGQRWIARLGGQPVLSERSEVWELFRTA
jgi:hypothetical protein